jgi:hypothetical protein
MFSHSSRAALALPYWSGLARSWAMDGEVSLRDLFKAERLDEAPGKTAGDREGESSL